MARTDHTAAPNAQLTQVVRYGVDPRGAGAFAALTGAARRELNNDRAVVAPPSAGGWIAAPQRFVGGLGLVRPVSQPSSTIGDQASTTVSDPIMAAFGRRAGS